MIAQRLLVKNFVNLNLMTEISIRGKLCVVLSENYMSRQRTGVEEGGWVLLESLRKIPYGSEALLTLCHI